MHYDDAKDLWTIHLDIPKHMAPVTLGFVLWNQGGRIWRWAVGWAGVVEGVQSRTQEVSADSAFRKRPATGYIQGGSTGQGSVLDYARVFRVLGCC